MLAHFCPQSKKFTKKNKRILVLMVPNVRFELTTYRLQDGCSTPELIRQKRSGPFQNIRFLNVK